MYTVTIRVTPETYLKQNISLVSADFVEDSFHCIKYYIIIARFSITVRQNFSKRQLKTKS
jgi:hypothetical protein